MRVPQLSVRGQWVPTRSSQLFLGFPHHGLDLIARNIARPSRQPDSRSSAQYLAVDLCINFHGLLDEGSETELWLLEDKESGIVWATLAAVRIWVRGIGLWGGPQRWWSGEGVFCSASGFWGVFFRCSCSSSMKLWDPWKWKSWWQTRYPVGCLEVTVFKERL